MRGASWVAAGLVVCAAAGAARADLIHLRSGGSISGTVISESPEAVVLQTPNGRISVPRRLIARVERQSRGETRLALARERAKAGAVEEAVRLYEEAARDPDPDIAEAARGELEALRRRLAKTKRHRLAPRWPFALPAGAHGEPIEGESLQEQLDRARQALDTGNGRTAVRLLEPLVRDNPAADGLRFLHARGLEQSRREEAARAEYARLLGLRPERSQRSAAWLGELARRALCGARLRSSTPGYGPAWERRDAAPFALYSQGEPEPWQIAAGPQALAAVLEALGVPRRRLFLSGRVQLFVHATPAEAQAAQGPLSLRLAPDGPLWVLHLPPAREALQAALQQRLARITCLEVYRELPAWTVAGAADWVAPERPLADLRAAAWAARTRGRLVSLAPVLADEDLLLQPAPLRGVQALLFRTLVLLGQTPAQVLALGQRIAEGASPAEALERARLDPGALEERFDLEAQGLEPPEEEPEPEKD